ncbi:unnamed protein product [Musa acuminata subsp. malaccensis]|uniref:Inositol oxygenase n=1 Tax=Musa acuminata subsp. malaccensis TaxID=214687 RepID=A0A8D7FJX4_MUSAM|nr:unnamed protein product [Musa acuminata subsp. malaccensis]
MNKEDKENLKWLRVFKSQQKTRISVIMATLQAQNLFFSSSSSSPSGDTFPVGCAFDECNVHHKYFPENPDHLNPKYNTMLRVYSEGCGLNIVLMSWGVDDYMYLIAKENKTSLPLAGLFIIRYHSFYSLHKHGAYQYLMNKEDKENLKWLRVKYDLYSKSKVRIDVEKVKPYYVSLIEKYFPAMLKW